MEEIISLDKEIFLFLNNLGNPTWDGFWLFVTNKFSSTPLYLLILFLIFFKKGKKKGAITLLSIILLITFVDQTSYHFFKNGIQRLRPCHDMEIQEFMRLVKDNCGGKFGFISGHASNSFGFAVFSGLILKKYFKYILPLLIMWACIVSYSRIYIGVHYPADIIFGAIYGIICGGGFLKLIRRFLHK
ncbi:phosphatase PAP2 family protein [Ichthyobacterium seriolicida]|uniref:Phosphoesterase pa-phosphatase related protein n=1 Tax=Ichthyobacterium seriolicida TaxID=242600 RepID=A0A1J1DYT8_9FLAO|nr:phosphatase PAP2 family protein [Ichthyobacterium seriolicida]BAV95065.1 phosphoesterase pa-phosphatase related protein [Ichthyobacterium seriolicida]